MSSAVWSPQRLTRIQARKLQLAAEQGGGIGINLRQASDLSAPYAAATRWLIKQARGEVSAQRWDVQLVHGHRGQIGKSIVLEVSRDSINPNLVRALDPLAHRPAPSSL